MNGNARCGSVKPSHSIIFACVSPRMPCWGPKIRSTRMPHERRTSIVDPRERVTEAGFARSPTRFPARLLHDSWRMISQPVSTNVFFRAARGGPAARPVTAYRLQIPVEDPQGVGAPAVDTDDLHGADSGRQPHYLMNAAGVNRISVQGHDVVGVHVMHAAPFERPAQLLAHEIDPRRRRARYVRTARSTSNR